MSAGASKAATYIESLLPYLSANVYLNICVSFTASLMIVILFYTQMVKSKRCKHKIYHYVYMFIIIIIVFNLWLH